MADIPVSTIVNVTISTAPTFPSRAGFGTLNIVGISTVIGVQERFRVYNDAAGVAADFSSSDEERKAADIHFAQDPNPSQLIISRRIVVATAAQVRGGGNSVLASLTAITDGQFSIDIDGTAAEVGPINFTGAADLDAAAALVETALQAADASAGFTGGTVTHDGNRFFIKAGTTGVASTIAFAIAPATGTDVKGTGLLEIDSTSATKTNGIDPESVTDSLDAIQDATADWYGLAFTKEVRTVDADVLEGAAWVEARIKVFGNDSDDNDILDSVVTNDIASQLKALNYRRTMTCFNSVAGEYLGVSALARAFIVNFNGTNTTITLKFKQMPGITTALLKTSEKTALDSKNANAFFSVGGNAMFGESFMASGVFFDEVHGIDWLQNNIETLVFGKLFTDITKTAMTDPGAASLQDKTEQALSQGVTNGLLAPGFDQSGIFLAKGYVTDVVSIKDHNQSDKEARIGPPISFKALGAGAIHSIQINGIFER